MPTVTPHWLLEGGPVRQSPHPRLGRHHLVDPALMLSRERTHRQVRRLLHPPKVVAGADGDRSQPVGKGS